MDHHERRRRGAAAERGDDQFFHKTLSRNSSVGCSSRLYYYRSAEGVPFNWERQPGTPKHPPKDETIPPLSPPPAARSLELPKPRFEQPKPQAATWPRLIRFWNKRRTNKQRKNNTVNAGFRATGSEKFEKLEFFSSDYCSEFMASARNSSRSSSSSSLSFSNGPSVQSSRLGSSGRDSFHGPLSCSPWKISAIVLSISRRG